MGNLELNLWVPLRRQALAVAVLGGLTVASVAHLQVPGWMEWGGVTLGVIYLLFADWLYRWGRQIARQAVEARR